MMVAKPAFFSGIAYVLLMAVADAVIDGFFTWIRFRKSNKVIIVVLMYEKGGGNAEYIKQQQYYTCKIIVSFLLQANCR